MPTNDYRGLIDTIYRAENAGSIDYDVIYGGIRAADRPSKPVTQMTVGEVLQWQDSIDPKYDSEAVGAPQVIEDTLRGLVQQGVVAADDMFDADTQDRITVNLMRGRGLDKWQAGKMSTEDFGTNLAKEWASLPVLKDTYRNGKRITRGSAYYGGVGSNRSRAFVTAVSFQNQLGEPGREVVGRDQFGHTGTAGATVPGNAGFRFGRQHNMQGEAPGTQYQEPWEQPDVRLDDLGRSYGLPDYERRFSPIDYRTRTGPGGGPMIHPSTVHGDWTAFTDEWTDSFIVRQFQQHQAEQRYDWDADFDPMQQVVDDGLQEHYKFLSGARNRQHYDWLRGQIDAEQQRNRRRAVSDHWVQGTMGALTNPDTVASVFIPLGAAARTGSTFLRAGGEAMVLTAAGETALEAGRSGLDPFSTPQDSLIRVGGASIMAGVLGGAMGRMAASRARRGLVDDVARDIARSKGVGKTTNTVDLGRGRRGTVRVTQTPEATIPGRGVRVVGDEVQVDAGTILSRFRSASHGTGARTPNELVEYEVARAASLARRIKNFARDESGSVRTGGRPFARLNDETGEIEVDMPRIEAARRRGKNITLGPAEGTAGVSDRITPLRVRADAFESADDAAGAIREAHDLAVQARDQAEFNEGVEAMFTRRGEDFTSARPWEDLDIDAQTRRQAEVDAQEALETYRRENNRILQNARTEALGRLMDGPFKRLHRNGLSPETRDLTDTLAADGGFLRGSDETGLTVGPSVYSRSKTWAGVTRRLYDKETVAYEKYLGFERNPTLADISVNKSFRKRRADGSRAIPIEEFRARVSHAHITGETDAIPEVNEMATHLRSAWDEYHGVAEEYGVLSEQKSIDTRAAIMRERMAEMDPESEAAANLQMEIDTLERQRRMASHEPDQDYFTRVYDRKAISENREAFKERVVKPWMRQQPFADVWDEGTDALGAKISDIKAAGNDINDPRYEHLRTAYTAALRAGNEKGKWSRKQFSTSERAIDQRAEDLVRQILEEAEPEDLSVLREPHRPVFGRHRQFNIPNRYLLRQGQKGNGIADFIETDYMLVHQIYSERMGPAIEMARSFARPVDGVSARDGFDEALAAAREAEADRFARLEGGEGEVQRRVHTVPRRPVSILDKNAADMTDDELGEALDYLAVKTAADEKHGGDLPGGAPPGPNTNWRVWSTRRGYSADEIADFDQWLSVADEYSERFGVDESASRAFARQEAADQGRFVRDLSSSQARTFEDHWAPIERDLLHLKDRVTNRVFRNPDRWDNRAATALRNWSHLAFMGMSALPAVQELGTLVMRHGAGRVWQNAFGELDEGMSQAVRLGVDEMRAAGGIMEVVNGAALSRFSETGFDAVTMTAPERWLRTAANKYFLWNGLAPLSTRLKELDAGLRVHDTLARIDRVHRLGGGADRADIEELARYGISRDDASAMAQQPMSQIEGGGWVANTQQWGDEALVRKFRAAIAQGNENTILMATAADKPTIIDGTMYFRKGGAADEYARKLGLREVGDYWQAQSGIMTLPFTFWNYAIAAHNKILTAGLDEPSSQKLGGIAAMLGLGFMVAQVRAPDWEWSQMNAGQKVAAAVDQSGIMGILSQFYGIAERETPMDMALRAAGAGPNVAMNAASGAATGDVNRMSWALPFRNHILLRDLYDAAVDGIERSSSGVDRSAA